MYLNVCVCDKFLNCQNCKEWNFRLFRPNLYELRLIHPYFVCKCSFREISMTKKVILDQSKPIFENKKFKNKKLVNCTSIIDKNRNKTCIQPILKSNYTSFLFNNIFGEMNIKKVIDWGVWGKWGNRPNFLLEV